MSLNFLLLLLSASVASFLACCMIFGFGLDRILPEKKTIKDPVEDKVVLLDPKHFQSAKKKAKKRPAGKKKKKRS
jgi:hypothetical protein